MVDKIKSNGAYNYPSQKQQRKSPAVQAYENTPGAKEAAEKKAAAASHAHSGKHANAAGKQDAQGVILDLSSKGKEHAAEQKKGSSWLSALRKLAAPFFKWLKDFWESDPAAAKKEAEIQQEAEKAEGLEPEMPDKGELGGELQEAEASGLELADLPPLDEIDKIPDTHPAIQEAVKSGSLQQLEQMLTQNGEKRLAHNSDLLTYYDRKGKLVELDETQKHRVLYGDKNILKL